MGGRGWGVWGDPGFCPWAFSIPSTVEAEPWIWNRFDGSVGWLPCDVLAKFSYHYTKRLIRNTAIEAAVILNCAAFEYGVPAREVQNKVMWDLFLYGALCMVGRVNYVAADRTVH